MRREHGADVVRARRTRMMVKKWSGYTSTKRLRAQRMEIVDAAGNLRAIFGTGGPMGDGAHLVILDGEGGPSTSLGLHDNGQAYVAVSGGESGRGMKMAVGPDGDIRLLATGEDVPLLYLGLDKEEGGQPISYLVLGDEDGKASVAITGRKSGSFVRLSDARGEVRASLEVGADGEPELHRVDKAGYPYSLRGQIYRTLNEAGAVYRAMVAVAFLLAGAVGGAWISGAASGSVSSVYEGPLTLGVAAATVVVFATLTVFVLYIIRQRR